ncbi:MAG: alpha/beta hydrolase, partial [Pseudomonadota bacterium]
MNILMKNLIAAIAFLILPAGTAFSASTDSRQGATLGYSSYGQGEEKVIVLHDWMGDARNYEPVIPYLDPNGFTWVFADVRGYGMSREMKGQYTVAEVAQDVFHLADSLGWKRFHVVGHSMNGMAVQWMAVDDWQSGAKRLKSVVAITPVTADGYPADEGTKQFLWNAIHNRDVSEQAFGGLTGGRLLSAWSRIKTT